MADPDWGAMAVVGHIARSHGTRGQVIVNAETDFPEMRFQVGRVLYMQRAARVEALTIESVRFHQGRPILGFRGVESIDDAERLGKGELRVPTETLAELPEDTFYRHDLVGCDVETVADEKIGVVSRVEGPLERSVLIVESSRGEVMIPMAAEICVRIDIGHRKIVVNPPPGLLDLNR